jgi:hypothetical protein
VNKRKNSARGGDGRRQSVKRPTPKVRLELGSKQELYTPGFVPSIVKRSENRVHITFIPPDPVPLAAGLETADCDLVAPHLVQELSVLIEEGPDLPWDGEVAIGTRLLPVLREYTKLLQQDLERRIAYGLADLSWRVAASSLLPVDALELAKKARGEQRWKLASGCDVSPEEIAKAARGSKRGPPTRAMAKAARVYAVLAWNSRASVQPVRIDGRTAGRSPELVQLLNKVAEFYRNLEKLAQRTGVSARVMTPRS